jgi:succinyl-CoA synthetase beta subunit
MLTERTKDEVRKIYEEAMRIEKERDIQRRSEPQYIYVSIRSLAVSAVLLMMVSAVGTIEIQRLSQSVPTTITEAPVNVERSGMPVEMLRREGAQVIASNVPRPGKSAKVQVRSSRSPGPI